MLYKGLMQLQQMAKVLLLTRALHDVVHKALFQQKLRPLEAFRQLLPDGLLDDARAGKADQRPRRMLYLLSYSGNS